ncbi:MAG: GntR family transcriptional regulator [Thermodesulfobacteriota bacterium]|nr:GntR family transcriptional regulator [Thermodesulfobacteriota bacterium]
MKRLDSRFHWNDGFVIYCCRCNNSAKTLDVKIFDWYDLRPEESYAMRDKQPFHPARYTESRLVTSILDGTYPPGTTLPNERLFAEQIGVTRQTLRETLQRLAGEGWITIRHGQSTMVNNYWQEGGLGLLSTLAKCGESLHNGFITHLLEFRVVLLPPAARLAVINAPEIFLEHLNLFESIGNEASNFPDFDWQLQVLFVRHSGNPIYPLILNDFASVFKIMAAHYFTIEEGRSSSSDYYLKLRHSIEQKNGDTEQIVRSVLEASINIWKNVNWRHDPI